MMKEKQFFPFDKFPYKEIYLESISKGDIRDVEISEILHEEIGSELMAVKMKLGKLAILIDDREHIDVLLSRLVSKIKLLSDSISPIVLGELGLGKALQQKCRRLNGISRINIVFQSFDFKKNQLDRETQLGLYHASSEVIDNCMKHANCSELKISTLGAMNKCIIKIEDDGDGFEPNEKLLMQKTYKGLQRIYSRVVQIGGKISFRKNVRGTVVTITVKK